MKIVMCLPCIAGLLAQAAPDTPSYLSVAIALLGIALTIVAFFLKTTLKRIEDKLEFMQKGLVQVAVLEDWRKTTDHRLRVLERG